MVDKLPLPHGKRQVNPQSIGIPAELLQAPIWNLWRYEERNGKRTKVPYRPDGRPARTNDPTGWVDYATALAALQRGGYDGIGILLGPVPGDPQGRNLAGIDIDWKDWKGPGTVAIPDKAAEVIGAFSTYTERSPSGKGCHLLFFGKLPDGARNRHTLAPGVELEVYDRGRYFTFTGDPIRPLPVQDQQAQLEALLDRLDRLSTVPKPKPAGPTPAQKSPKPVGLSDEELLWRMFRSKAGPKIRRLWEGDRSLWEGPEAEYPSQSEADLALLSHLLWWTGGDVERANRLFQQSGLYREKWDQQRGKHTYGERTIEKALNGLNGGYNPRQAFSQNGSLTGGENGNGRDSAVTLGIKLVRERARLWVEKETNKAWATIPVDDHWENWPLRSPEFQQWLAVLFFETYGRGLGSQAFQDIVNTLEGYAFKEGKRYPTYYRIASLEGEVWVDTGRPDWKAWRITAQGIALEDPPPEIRFRRSRTMGQLPDPDLSGTIADLRDFAALWGLAAPKPFAKFAGWLVGCFSPGPHPPLVIRGEQGSGKTTLTRAIRSLIDPGDPKHLPRDARTLFIGARNSYILAFDNVSKLDDWLSNALCQITTGGLYEERKLYTDDEIAVFRARIPIILNGITDFLTQQDLIDRVMVLDLPPPQAGRLTERELWKHIEEERPKLIGALFNLVSLALQNLDSTPTPEVRMADFAHFVQAAEPGFGVPPGTFIEAYLEARQDAVAAALEGEPVYGALVELLEVDGGFRGTATELLNRLNELRGDESTPPRWPRNPRGLVGALQRLAPVLRREGILLTLEGRVNGKRIWRIERIAPPPEGPDSEGPGPEGSGPEGSGPSTPPSNPPSSPSPSPGDSSPRPVGEGASSPTSRTQEGREASTPPTSRTQERGEAPTPPPSTGGGNPWAVMLERLDSLAKRLEDLTQRGAHILVAVADGEVVARTAIHGAPRATLEGTLKGLLRKPAPKRGELWAVWSNGRHKLLAAARSP